MVSEGLGRPRSLDALSDEADRPAVRLIDASSQADKRFDLDDLAISVTYRP